MPDINWVTLYVPASITVIVALATMYFNFGISQRLTELSSNQSSLKTSVTSLDAKIIAIDNKLVGIEKDLLSLQAEFSASETEAKETLGDLQEMQQNLTVLTANTASKDSVFELTNKVKDNVHLIENNYMEMTFHVSKILESFSHLKDKTEGMDDQLDEITKDLKTHISKADKEYLTFSHQIQDIFNKLSKLQG